MAEGKADLAFYQTQPAFLGNQQADKLDTLSIVSKVDVAPYALYSSKWKDLAPTDDWVNSNLVADKITGTSLPPRCRGCRACEQSRLRAQPLSAPVRWIW